jgi:hypothetical protein
LNKGRLDAAAQKGGLFVKHKRKAILILVVIMLMGAMLTGCNDRDNDTNSPTENSQPAQPNDPFAPPIQNAPQRPNTPPRDPNEPPPERNPDGTIG